MNPHPHVASDLDDDTGRESVTAVIIRGRTSIADRMAALAGDMEALVQRISDSGWPPPIVDEDTPSSSAIPSVH